jgi:hypothetical protein
MSTARLLARNIPIVLIVLAFAAGAVFLFIAHPAAFKTMALWFIGLAGFIYASFRRFVDFLSGGSIDDVEKRNEEIKRDAERLRGQIEESNQRLERERATYEREITRLEAVLAKQRNEYEASKAEMERVRRMNYKEYFDSLPPEEREKLQDEMMEGVQVL